MFSIILPFHMDIALLERSLASVAGQTLQPDEIIVIDNSPEHLLADYQTPCSPALTAKLSIIPVTRKQHAALARNVGIKKAKAGNHIAFLDSGDVWHAQHLSQAQDYFAAHAGHKKVVYYASYLNFDMNKSQYWLRQSQPVDVENDLLKFCTIGTSSVIVAGLQPYKFPPFKRRHDLALWVTLKRAGFVFVHNPNCNVLRVIEKGSLSSPFFRKLYAQALIYRYLKSANVFLIAKFLMFQALAKASFVGKKKSSIDDIQTTFGFSTISAAPQKQDVAP